MNKLILLLTSSPDLAVWSSPINRIMNVAIKHKTIIELRSKSIYLANRPLTTICACISAAPSKIFKILESQRTLLTGYSNA